MNTQLEEILRQLSQESGLALKELVYLNIRTAKKLGYCPTTTEESKKIGEVLRNVPDMDLGVILLKVGPEFGCLRAFFEAEGQRRHRQIAGWAYRGMNPDQSADIITVSRSLVSAEV